MTISPASPIVPFEFVSATEAVLYNCIAGPLVCVTVTVAVQVSVFPHWSVTVRVTVFGPKSALVKLLGLTLKVTAPQLSELPLSTSAPVMVAFPLASKPTVVSWHNAVGAVVSFMFIVWVIVLALVH